VVLFPNLIQAIFKFGSLYYIYLHKIAVCLLLRLGVNAVHPSRCQHGTHWHASLFSGYNRDASYPSAKKMPPIQLSPLLHHLLNFFKRLWITSIGGKLRKLDVRQVSFLQTFFRRCLLPIIGRVISKFCRNRPSTLYDEAGHHSHRLFDNVDCFSKLPILPLHHEDHPDPRTTPSTSSSQAVVPYSTTPLDREDINMSRSSSTCSSITARAEDDCKSDTPGLTEEISDFVGVTSVEFERYERNVTSYVLNTDQR
jgi:hypothetical protein